MKLKEGLILEEINNEYVLVDTGLIKPRYNGMIKLNKTGCDIIKALQKEIKEDELIDIIYNQYDENKDVIKRDIDNIINVLRSNKLLNEE